MSWTDERVATLVKLNADSCSCAEIAAELGGCTRNAVIGKLSRMGLSRGARVADPRAAELRADRQRTRRAQGGTTRAVRIGRVPHIPTAGARADVLLTPEARKKAKAERAAMAISISTGFECIEVVNLTPDEQAIAVTLEGLCASNCHWPYGDPRDFGTLRFCGAPAAGEGPYCAPHHRLAHQ